MKRYLWLFFLMTISLTFLPGCENEDSDQPVKKIDWTPTIYDTVDNFKGVTMTAKEGTVSRTGMTVILQNNSDKQGVYGEAYLLKRILEATGTRFRLLKLVTMRFRVLAMTWVLQMLRNGMLIGNSSMGTWTPENTVS